MPEQSSVRKVKGAFEAVTLLASGARTANGNGSAVKMPMAQAYAFVLDQTNAASAVDDTCDVFVQTKLDGTNWVDVVHFTQTLGNGTDALRYITRISAHITTAEFENATALGAAAVRNLIGDEWRVRYAIVTGAGTHSFTFSVVGIPM